MPSAIITSEKPTMNSAARRMSTARSGAATLRPSTTPPRTVRNAGTTARWQGDRNDTVPATNASASGTDSAPTRPPHVLGDARDGLGHVLASAHQRDFDAGLDGPHARPQATVWEVERQREAQDDQRRGQPDQARARIAHHPQRGE